MRLKKIDMHVHAVTSHGLPRPRGDNYPLPSDLMEAYDHLGIDRGNLLPSMGVECGEEQSTNREIRSIVETYPDRFSWFCNIDPRQCDNSPDSDFSYFFEYYKNAGAKGVGEICANLYFDDPRVMNLFSYCEKFEMPVIIHIGHMGGDYGLVDEIGLPRLEKILKTFPKLTVIGHSQKFWSEISGDNTPEKRAGYPAGKVVPGGRVPELLQKYPNLYADLSAGSGANAILRDPEFGYQFLEQFQDKLYFGTDMCATWQYVRDTKIAKLSPFLDDAVDNGHISEDAYYKISRGNAEKLLGLV